MARPASSRLQGLITVSGMVAFIGAVSIAPRISILKTDDSTIIKYDHLNPKSKHQTPAPADPGLIIAPGPKPPTSSPTSSTPSQKNKPFGPDDWIFDTGATTHVCANRALLHSYDTLNPYNNSVNPRAVGYFGPNPVPIVGAGDCTFILPGDDLTDVADIGNNTLTSSSGSTSGPPGHSRSSSSMLTSLLGVGPGRSTGRPSSMVGDVSAQHSDPSSSSDNGDQNDPTSLSNSSLPPHYKAVTRLTVKNVMHIPTAGVNLISWSQLKRAKGLQLRLVEEPDGSLIVQHQDGGRQQRARTLMRFEPRDGLFFLVQADVSPMVRREIER
ncbi:hypothetical protein ABEF95_005473 [Exophiala dermatitidis]